MSETSNQTVIKLADLVKPAEPFVLSEQERHEIEHELHHYPDSRAASIEALKIVQKHRGWVCDEAIPVIAQAIGISAADLEGVATFYSLIFRRPVGRNVIKVCDSISCHLTGYEELRDAFVKELGIRYGQTTADNRFTLLPICCLGACDRGATVMINDDLHGPVEPADVAKLLEAYV
ncbi:MULTISPECIES: NADH-quinone oxidoreductase subunit NuoE [Hydrocarboniphaga]|jgi:NADH-quinone oxidoreductase subunit E|uniref:NADH-quinone oxidoreductase subunit E n=1 Tax=Hydrocarboniphaga effusa AP103 TaxID=1172194 RepID=I7Z929_9GAMM|nr:MULTISPECIES: NADH-quinone oxidoreductase subunit NuoE [Hydrocarboniphaga]EIT68334.1 NADH dehydrogenase I chain E [Hydrocarboniphaga effusa AP103]MDZ4078682.1 NADH-quinone oxidoreductase subunit NuoE [Hydrocarboniphaga sp.]